MAKMMLHDEAFGVKDAAEAALVSMGGGGPFAMEDMYEAGAEYREMEAREEEERHRAIEEVEMEAEARALTLTLTLTLIGGGNGGRGEGGTG